MTPRKPSSPYLVLILTVALALLAAILAAPGWSQTLPTVGIAGVEVDTDSAKVEIQPFPGAQDYAIYNVKTPTDLKYAGQWHLDADLNAWPYSNMQFKVDANGNPVYPLTVISDGIPMWSGSYGSWWSQYHHIDIPATEIQANNLPPGVPETFVVVALSSLGPCGYQCLYNIGNQRIYPLDSDCNPAIGMCALGSDMGCEWWADQIANGPNWSGTNGQGPYTNNPQVIGESAPFTITANAQPPIPSEAAASQTFFDDFRANGTLTPMQGANVTTGEATQTLTTQAGTYNVLWDHADVVASNDFASGLHWMPVLFDGYSTESNNPQHVAYSANATEPQETVNFANGILHITFEVDAHTDTRRWIGCAIASSTDPLQHFDWEEGEAINSSNSGLFFQWENNSLLVAQLVNGKVDSILGTNATYEPYPGRPFQNYQFGHGLDNRSRFDIFVSSTQFEVFEDGKTTGVYPLGNPLTYASAANVYFTQYLYHSGLEQQELEQLRPYETFWINIMPYSDERHWNDFGFEVLPASTSWSSLGSLIQMPQPVPPVYAPVNPAPPAAPMLSATAGNAQVALSWTASNGGSSYNLYRGTASGQEMLYQSGLTATSYTDAEVANGTTYYYEVTAVNAGGESPKSNEVSATPSVPILTASGVFVQVNVAKGSAALTFDTSTGTVLNLTTNSAPLAATAASNCLTGLPVTITYQGNSLISIQ